MKVLIVESSHDLASLWQRHLERQSMVVWVATSVERAFSLIASCDFDVIVLDLFLAEGSALAVADYAQYRQPATNLIVVTSSQFFSDGSIFALTPNARACVPVRTPPDDLAAMVAHWGRAS